MSSNTLKKISLEDKPNFDKAYSSLKMPLADQSFEMIYIWNKLINVRWTKINDNLCCFADFEGRTVIWGPVIGGNKIKETLTKCFEIGKELNGGAETELLYLPEEVSQAYEAAGFKISNQNQDYVYLTTDLISLKGDKYKNKRNMVNSFVSNYKYLVENYDASKHKKGCMALLSEWKKLKEEESSIGKVKFQFKTEILLSKETIELASILPIKGLVVIVDGKIVGMTFGYKVNSEMCAIAVEKTHSHIKGISEFIFQEFVKRHWQDFKYVNAQEDMDVPYIKATKMSYNPFKLIKSYKVSR